MKLIAGGDAGSAAPGGPSSIKQHALGGIQVLHVEPCDTDALIIDALQPSARGIGNRGAASSGEPEGWQLARVRNLGEAAHDLEDGVVRVVLFGLDEATPDELEPLMGLTSRRPDLAVVVLGNATDPDSALRALQAGAQDYLAKSMLGRELLGRAVRYAVERQRSRLELQRVTVTDGLTGLPNRAYFDQAAPCLVARAARRGDDLAVLVIDLDEFKRVNDGLGRAAGDEVLACTGRRLRRLVRRSDLVARLGGDEFVVVAEGLADRADARQIAQKLLDGLGEAIPVGDEAVALSASVGVAMLSDLGADTEALLRGADDAMCQAKSTGRSEVNFFDPEPRRAFRARRAFADAARAALDEGLFELVYQPVIDLRSHRLVGTEALVRWGQDPLDPLHMPGRFVPLLEQHGLIERLGRWVLSEATQAVARLSEAAQRPLRMAVNVSVHELDDPRIADRVLEALNRASLSPDQLAIELTETAVPRDSDALARRLKSVRDLGVHVAIDDFGTGWSSLSRLCSLPVDQLKIDRSFVSRAPTERGPAGVCAAVLAMAKELSLTVVAEGVETVQQLRWLEHHGCHMAQGYLLGRPQPEGRLIEALRVAARTPSGAFRAIGPALSVANDGGPQEADAARVGTSAGVVGGT